MLEERVLALVRQFLAAQIPVDDFARDFAGLYFSVRQSKPQDAEASRLCGAIVGPYAEYSRGDRSEESLRRSLAEILHRFDAAIQLDKS